MPHRNDDPQSPDSAPAEPPVLESALESAREASTLLGASTPMERHARAGELVRAIPALAITIPTLFWLRFGVVDAFALGVTAMLVVWCALAAIGLRAIDTPSVHSPVAARRDLFDRIGAFWLVACAFGPFASWVIGQLVPLTAARWHLVVAAQLALCAGLPLVTMVPNLRYARGGARWIGLAILIGVTALPVGAARNLWLDLREGPVADGGTGDGGVPVLPHSRRAVR